MRVKAGREKADDIYQDWIQGQPIKLLVIKYRISRQRIYKILNDYKHITEKEKMLRAVNKLSAAD